MATIELVVFSAEAKMACGDVVVSLRRLATVVECCVDGDGFCASAGDGFVCVGWRRLSCVGWRWLCVRRMATAFCASDGDGFSVRRMVCLALAFFGRGRAGNGWHSGSDEAGGRCCCRCNNQWRQLS